MDRGGHIRGARECGGGGCVKALVDKTKWELKRLLLLLSGGGGGSPIMLWVIGWTRAWKEPVGIDVRSRVIVDGLEKIAKRAVMYRLR